MARLSLSLLGAVLYATAVAARCCTNLTIPVTASSRNGKFNMQPPKNNIDVSDFVLKLARRGNNYTRELLEETHTVSGTYNIAATYCIPNAGKQCAKHPEDGVLQILTHGVGFDRSYWDLPYANYNYSYVNQALARGYSTLSYDRFGIGQSFPGSNRVDPINEVQSWLEIAILEQLTTMLRKGSVSLGQHQRIPKFSKTVHVGHSFGSIQSYALGAMRPDLSDGLILTGFSQVGDYLPFFLLGADFVGVDTIPGVAAAKTYAGAGARGYVAPRSVAGVQQNFFAPGQFDPAVLDLAYTNGQPVTYGELLTLGAAGGASKFGGPVLIITGDFDVPFCGGNCTTATSTLLEKSASNLKNASYFETFVVPNSGHGLNFEYTWPTTYNKMLDFLRKHV